VELVVEIRLDILRESILLPKNDRLDLENPS
jgi:hypothetical protein